MTRAQWISECMIILVIALPIDLWAGPVPDTGQTKCYNDSEEITCPDPGSGYYGQDAQHTINPHSYTKLGQNGVKLPDTATQAEGWIMTRDNVTGLIWEVKTDDNSIHDKDDTYNWQDSQDIFITDLNANSFGGYSDWRMPTHKELNYLVNCDILDPGPMIDTAWFPNTVSSKYWSSTTYAEDTNRAWHVDFATGGDDSLKSKSYCVRAVRGVQFENAYVDNGDNTITDTSTGLMWQQATPGMDNWREALSYARGLTFSGYSDWRLPNRNELQSIVDYDRYQPSIDPTFFPDTISLGYWSSTTYAGSAGMAWQVKFEYSHVTKYGYKSLNYPLRVVRGGQNQLLDHLIILTPSQGCGWTPGTVKEITWETKEIPGNVKISLSREGGKDGTFTETIVAATANDGSYTWTVTGPNSFNCMLKIEPLESGYEDMGTVQGLFTIDDPVISVDPSSYYFGEAIVGYSCTVQTFTITNEGYGELEISGVSITGTDDSDFSIISSGCTDAFQPSYSCEIEVEFCPSSSGEKSAKLAISSNDPTEPLTELSLTGTGLDPAQLMVIPSEDFEASGFPGGPFSPNSKVYTIENTGDVTFDWTASKSTLWVDLSGVSGTLEPSGTTTVTVFINNLSESFMLGTYEDTVIFVNTTNGEGNTTRDVILNITKPSSTVSCVLSSNNIILGSPLTVSGEIEPAPSESGAFVDVVLTPSFGQAIHRSTLANAQGTFSHEVHCGDIYKAGDWVVQTGWSGDDTLQGATSVGEDLAVSKAESKVTLDVSSQAVKLGDLVSIAGKFTPEPDCGRDLTELIQITLFISGPGGTDIQYVQTNDPWGHFVLEDYGGFDMLGEWTVEASFAGDEAYLPSSSYPVEVQVVETAGYAVVVQGKITSEEGLDSHNKTAQFVYETLLDRGLLADDIMYFNYDYGNPVRTDIDALPTQAGVEDAITDWAVAKMNAKPANLYIIMLDHGLEDVFYIHPEDITAAELKSWLDTLQAGLTGQAADQEVITLLGFCRSGSLIDDLSGINRVIIASAAADESSYKGPLDEDGIREGEYFVSEFFKKVSFGKSVKECFEHATALTEVFTSSGTGESTNAPYYDDSMQHPLLDDNGDGEGSNDLCNPDSDGLLSEDLFIGVSSITGNDPGDVTVIEKTATRFLGVGENSVNLWARVDDNPRLRVIWTEVKPPGYNPVDPPGSGQAEMVLAKTYGAWNPGTFRYEWTDLGTGPSDPDFSDPGTYQVFYFAKDDNTENVSPLVESWVYKAKDPNAPPNAFNLVAPADGTDVLTTFILDWEDTTDPDGDSMTYTVLISEDDDLFTNPICIERLKYSTCLVVPADGIKDLTDYYWKVRAIDAYGAYRETGVWQFSTDNTNPTAAWIEGCVYDLTTGVPIANAVINVSGLEFCTELNGYYIGTTNPGTYTISASAVGYEGKSYPGVIFPDGGIVTRDFGLEPLSAGSAGALPAILLLLLGE